MPTKIPRKKKKGAPKWALDPFHHFLDEAERLSNVVRLSSTGIKVLQSTPKIIEVLMKVENDDSSEASQRLENARKDAGLAKHEVETDFPVLHSWAVVGQWAVFEASIRSFIAEWLKHKPTAWQVEPILKLKIRLGEYELIPKNQRHYFIVEMLEKELRAGLKTGVSRFESLLEPFGLSGELPENLRRDFYEFSQVRNLIVHNASKVDRRFTDACPWLETKIGQRFHISHEMFLKYNLSAIVYISLIICRVGEHYGVDMSEDRTSFFEKVNAR